MKQLISHKTIVYLYVVLEERRRKTEKRTILDYLSIISFIQLGG